MLDHKVLRDIATKEAGRLVADLVSGETSTRAGDHEGRWDPMLRRHVHAQSLVAWRHYGKVSMLVSDKGRVLAFQDQNRLDNAQRVELDPAAVLRVCRTSGMLAKSAQIASSETNAANLLVVVVEQRHHALPQRIRFAINTQLRLVAALQVLEDV